MGKKMDKGGYSARKGRGNKFKKKNNDNGSASHQNNSSSRSNQVQLRNLEYNRLDSKKFPQTTPKKNALKRPRSQRHIEMNKISI